MKDQTCGPLIKFSVIKVASIGFCKVSLSRSYLRVEISEEMMKKTDKVEPYGWSSRDRASSI